MVFGLQFVGAGARTEPGGLTNTDIRPVDVQTAVAVPGRSAALDVRAASSNTAAAGVDVAEVMFRRKFPRYRRDIPQPAAVGIVYRPFTWPPQSGHAR